jgi:NADH-quinone oxidoreductase subunit N
MDPGDILAVAPLLCLFGAAILCLLIDLFWRDRVEILQIISYLGMASAGYLLLSPPHEPRMGFANSIAIDGLVQFCGLVILGSTLLTILISTDYVRRLGIKLGEYYALLLFCCGVMILVAASNDLITLFLSIEAMSIAIYILTCITRHEHRSTEGAIKYFVIGAFATSFLLYGMSLLYGASGTLYLHRLADSIASEQLLGLGVVAILIGFAFKLGAVPFHMWVPDAYEGAPTAITGFMAVTVKAAGFAALLRLILVGLTIKYAAVWVPILWCVAVLTMLVGNLMALPQANLKRMLAYSSIAHTGYALMGVVTISQDAIHSAGSALFYILVYSFMTIGAFAFLIYTGTGEMCENYQGFARRRPWAAAAMALFMISLAGIPPTAGFFGKFYIFKIAIQQGYYLLTAVAILTTIISLYYYLRVITVMYMHEERIEVSMPTDKSIGMALLLTSIFIAVLGLFPSFYLWLSQRSILLSL